MGAMAYKPSQTSINRSTYIPPHIEQAMAQHMQQSMPANLKKYMSQDGGAAYIPRSMESTLSNAMQKNMPAHLKQYAGAYMQQKVMQPNGIRPNVSSFQPPRPAPHPPVPDPLRRGHSMPGGEQHTVELNTLPIASKSMFESQSEAQNNLQPPPQPQGGPQVISGSQQPQPNGEPSYDFIMDPGSVRAKKFGLPGLSPKLFRLSVALFGLLLLLIIFSVVKSVLSGGSNLPQLTTVMQDQQELLHITSPAILPHDISGNNSTFSATTQLTMSSSYTQLQTYLAANHIKVNPKLLNLKISSSTDQALTTAEAAGTYNQTFNQVAQSDLNGYLNDLGTAYNVTKGLKGRALLTSDYNQAKLLLVQLNQGN